MKKLFLGILAMMFIACGGGGGGSNSGGDGGEPQSDFSVNGVVVHSVFSTGDRVCYDRNGNKTCDEGEPNAVIAADGKYTLVGSNADAVAVPIVAELANTGNLRARSTALVFETPAGQRTLSSLTTLIKAEMDSNPMFSLADAHDAIQADLGTSEDLFKASNAAAELAAKVSSAIVAMFAKLSAEFGINISDKVIVLVISEILPQLSNIANGSTAAEDVFDNSNLNGKNAEQINTAAKDIIAKQPKLLSGADLADQGSEFYEFGYDTEYRFLFSVLSATALRNYINGGDYQMPLPDETSQNSENSVIFKNNDGSITLEVVGRNNTSKLINVEIIPIGGQTINASPRHSSKAVNFSTGASMYKMSVADETSLPSVSDFRNSNCNIYAFHCGGVNLNNNTIEVRWGNDDYDIRMNNDGTYEVVPNNASLLYDSYRVHSVKRVQYRGRYEKTSDSEGDVYIFKDIDGRNVLQMFRMNRNSYYYIAGSFGIDNQIIFFNKIAAEDIQDQW